MRVLSILLLIVISCQVQASIPFMRITPISLSDLGEDEYRFVFINHGLEWLPEPDQQQVTLRIIYRPKCLQDNAINFGLETDSSNRKANYQAAVELLRQQVQANSRKQMVFGFKSMRGADGTYVTHNLRIHHNSMKNTNIVWSTGAVC